MEKQLWVKRVADRLYAGEAKIDEATRLVMELVQEVHAAQVDMNISATANDGALAKMMETLAGLQAARTSLVAGHRRIERTAHDLGMKTTMDVGGTPVKPPPHIEDGANEELIRVAR